VRVWSLFLFILEVCVKYIFWHFNVSANIWEFISYFLGWAKITFFCWSVLCSHWFVWCDRNVIKYILILWINKVWFILELIVGRIFTRIVWQFIRIWMLLLILWLSHKLLMLLNLLLIWVWMVSQILLVVGTPVLTCGIVRLNLVKLLNLWQSNLLERIKLVLKKRMVELLLLRKHHAIIHLHWYPIIVLNLEELIMVLAIYIKLIKFLLSRI